MHSVILLANTTLVSIKFQFDCINSARRSESRLHDGQTNLTRTLPSQNNYLSLGPLHLLQARLLVLRYIIRHIPDIV